MIEIERPEQIYEKNCMLNPQAHPSDAESVVLESALGKSQTLRPQRLKDFPGQIHIKANLEIAIRSALMRKTVLDHVILHGPPGLGKTTLAHIIAHELGTPFYASSGPVLNNPGDLVGILSGLASGAVFFIDEIHRIPVQVEEMLYSAMEDGKVDIVIGQGTTSRSVPIYLNPFTLIGATTRLSNLSRPFLNRFGIQEKLDFYDHASLTQILMRSAGFLAVQLVEEGAFELAKRSRGTPRIANRFLRRVIDFAVVSESQVIDSAMVAYALQCLDVDALGLDRTDRGLLKALWEHYQGGPVGIEALAILLGEERATIEDVYEPFLVHSGLISRSPRGRILTSAGRAVVSSEKMS